MPSSSMTLGEARTSPSRSPQLDYPPLARAARFMDNASTPLPAAPLSINVERDYARSGVNLHVRAGGPYEGLAVIDRIVWRAIQPGEEVQPNPLWLDERAARVLAEQLGEFHPEMRRLARTREQLDASQNELRSLSNQLEEIRNHNLTLVRTNQEQQRQCRWLERELRDANRERRSDD